MAADDRSTDAPKEAAPGAAGGGAADAASRAWGVLVLAAGLWFFAQVTLGIALPAVPWSDLWPVALIVIGLAVIARSLARRG